MLLFSMHILFAISSLLLMLSSESTNQNPPSPVSSNQISPLSTNENEQSLEAIKEVTEKTTNQSPAPSPVNQSAAAVKADESPDLADQSERNITEEKPPLPAGKPPLPEKPLVLPKPVLLPKPDAPMYFG